MSITKINEEGDIDLTLPGEEPTNPQEPVKDSDPDVEVISDPAVEQPTEDPVLDPVTDPSSLTPQPEAAPAVPTVETVPEINDDIVTQYLSEKLGKEVTLDSLVKEPEPIVNPLEQDPQLKEIYEWRQRTGRPVSDWAKFQKDYSGMSNIDVLRESLQLQYPDLTPEEVQLELSNYTPKDDDLEEEKIRKNLNLKKLASDGRKMLNEFKSEYDTALPVKGSLTPEEKQKIEAFDTYQAQLSESQAKLAQYQAGIAAEVSSLNSLPLTLSEDMSIDFNVPEESKKTLQQYMEMPHWFNPDGSYNHKEVVKDSLFMQNKDAILKLAYEQGRAKGIEESDKDSRNITLDQPRQTMSTANTQTDDIVVEDSDPFGSSFGTKIRFGRNK